MPSETLSLCIIAIARAIALSLILYGGVSLLRETVQGILGDRGEDGASRLGVMLYCLSIGSGIALLMGLAQ